MEQLTPTTSLTPYESHPGMDDFLLSAICVLQSELELDAFLRDVLEEIIKKKTSSPNHIPHMDSSNFQAKTLTELKTRITRERGLNLEIERLSKARDDERVGRAELCALAEERDASIAEKQHMESQRQEATYKLQRLESTMQQQIADIQAQANSEKARLEAQVAILSKENICKEQALRDLEDEQVRNWELNDEIDQLRVNNNKLKSDIVASKKRDLELSRVQIIRRPRDKGQSDYNGDTSDAENSEDSESEADVKYGPNIMTILPSLFPSGIPRLPNPTLSQARRVSLNDPEYSGALPDHDRVSVFNRTLLMEQLGGGPVSLQVHIRPGREKPLARRLGLSTFMCPNFDYNPWAPLSPGKNGFMFVGLGLEKDAFLIPETHEVFVQFAPKKMFYAGRYRCSKVEDLSPEEWTMLGTKFRRKYSETTKSKAKDSRSTDEIMTAYNEGRLRAPCVSLKCIDYSWELYHSLSHAARSVDTSPSRRSSILQNPRKRKRLTSSEHSESEDEGPETPRRYAMRPQQKKVYVELPVETPNDFEEYMGP